MKVELQDNVVDPSACNTPITGFLMFAIKEAAEYAGLVEGKVAPWRLYKNLLRQKNELQKES